MRRSRLAAAALAGAALLAGCGSSLWEKTGRVVLPSSPARLFVPRTFLPLVPGSIYPDRAHPVSARGLPAVLVVVPGVRARDLAPPLGRRGLVALVGGPGLRIDEGLARLREIPQAGGPVGLLLERPSAADLARPGVRAIVVAGEIGVPPPGHPPILALRTGTPSGPETEGVSERWYASPSGGLPKLAWQDAADWLSDRLR